MNEFLSSGNFKIIKKIKFVFKLCLVHHCYVLHEVKYGLSIHYEGKQGR